MVIRRNATEADSVTARFAKPPLIVIFDILCVAACAVGVVSLRERRRSVVCKLKFMFFRAFCAA